METLMLLVAFVAFAILTAGWTILPHKGEVEHAPSSAVPTTHVARVA